jgi:hypothetical protein
VAFGFILFSYTNPGYTKIDAQYGIQTIEYVVYEEEYLKSLDLIQFLQVFTFLLIAAAIMFAGLLYYLKPSE